MFHLHRSSENFELSPHFPPLKLWHVFHSGGFLLIIMDLPSAMLHINECGAVNYEDANKLITVPTVKRSEASRICGCGTSEFYVGSGTGCEK